MRFVVLKNERSRQTKNNNIVKCNIIMFTMINCQVHDDYDAMKHCILDIQT